MGLPPSTAALTTNTPPSFPARTSKRAGMLAAEGRVVAFTEIPREAVLAGAEETASETEAAPAAAEPHAHHGHPMP